MENRDNKNNHHDERKGISIDRLITEIKERAQQISEEENDADSIPFSNWLRAEQEIRKKYGLTARSKSRVHHDHE